jgi:hypothetical protein
MQKSRFVRNSCSLWRTECTGAVTDGLLNDSDTVCASDSILILQCPRRTAMGIGPAAKFPKFVKSYLEGILMKHFRLGAWLVMCILVNVGDNA